LKRLNSMTVVQYTLETGRTHQLRIHSKYIGHPIVGDSLYGNESNLISRQALHATEIEFNVYKDKLQKFMVLMGEYAFPIGSYFEIDGQGHYKLFEDNLSGIRLEFKNLDDEGIEKLYSDISNLNDKYQYETLIRYGGRVFVYYYSSDIDLFKSSLNKYIEDNGLKRKIEIYSMPEVFKDIGEK